MISYSGNHMKRMRLIAGLGIHEVARMTKVRPKTLYAIEEDRNKPSIDLAVKLRKIYHTSLDAIYLPYYGE